MYIASTIASTIMVFLTSILLHWYWFWFFSIFW